MISLSWCEEASKITAFMYMGQYVWVTKTKNVNETALLLA